MMKATYFLATTLALAPTAMAQLTPTWGDEKNCQISGDPHFYPFGTSQYYDNMLIGHFNYVYGLDGNLVIQGNQRECLGDASCLESVAVLFCGTRLQFSADDALWKEVGSEGSVNLPPGFKIDNTVLSLPDDTQIKVVANSRQGLKWLNLWISLPEIYNNKVKGMCGVYDDAVIINTDNNDIAGEAHHVHEGGNSVTVEANVLNCENGVSLPVLSDDVVPPFTCPADQGTGNEIVEGTSDDTGPLVEGTTIPNQYTEDEMGDALRHCQDYADAQKELYESCPDLTSSVEACQVDLLGSNDLAETTLLEMIQEACTGKTGINCHLRQS